MNKAVFIDKDGTLIHDVPYNVQPRLIELENYVGTSLHMLQQQGYLLIVISNQSGVARGYFKEEALHVVNKRITELLKPYHTTIDDFYYCPHFPDGIIKKYAIECDCRKPKAGMLLKAAAEYNIELNESWMIGDILNDAEAGNAAGCSTILIDNGNETEWIMNEQRKPSYTVKNFKEAAEIILQKTNSRKNMVHAELE